MSKILALSQFSSLASSASSYTASVAAASSAAIRELAEAVLPGSDTTVITASPNEPNDDDYWLYIEEVEDDE